MFTTSALERGATMRLSSPAYSNGETMPSRYAAVEVTGGKNLSVPLAWDAGPPATRSFVLAMIDTHPVAHGWVHWLITDIPPETRGLPEGASHTFSIPFGAREMLNTGGTRGYAGPRPPVGSGVHDYVTNLYALDVEHLSTSLDASWDEVRAAISGHGLANMALVGCFGR
jgi:Raf kinase inhibitor-like YbhB/YbcL family protein